VDRSTNVELDTLRAEARGSQEIVPFRGRDKRGYLVVAATGTGLSRATLVVR
jgi:hypothetical protein